MAFPTEAEEQIRGAVLSICQDHIRKTVEAVRELALMIDDYISGQSKKNLDDHLLRIKELKDEADDLKRAILTELAERGMLLMSREALLKLVIEVNSLANSSEAIAFRIGQLSKSKREIKESIKSSLLALGKNVLKAVTALRQTIFALKYDRAQALDLAKDVDTAEYVVDEIYRNLDAEIIESKLDFATIIVLREIASSLEGLTDKIEDAADAVRILALGL
jgi:predicted phosphate transport protein (TIGR00153 family)